MDNNTFTIRKFNPECLTRGSITATLVGKRAVGKTTLITKDLLPRIGSICQGSKIIVSPTEQYHEQYSKQVDPRFIHDTLSPELLDQVTTNQMRLCHQSPDRPESLLVLDDCLYDRHIISDRNLRKIFMNGRHMGMNMIIAQQFPNFPPSLRANIDYIFLFRESNTRNKQKLYEYYAGMFPTFGLFCQVLDECTRDYGYLVIDNVTRSDRLEDQVFWYQAQEFDPRRGAVTVIANKWRQVLAKRQLARLRIGFEIKLLPGIGIKYQEAAERFKQVQSEQNQFYD